MRNIVLLISCFFFLSYAKAETYKLQDQKSPLLGKFIEIYEDKEGELSWDQVLTKQGFYISDLKVPNLGVSKSTFWVKLELVGEHELDQLLVLQQPIIDDVEFFLIKGGQLIANVEAGEIFPFHDRKYKDPYYIFDLPLTKDQKATVLLRLKGKEQIQVPLVIGPVNEIMEELKFKNILSGIFVGFMLFVIFYNAFIYFASKDISYLYYVLYAVVMLFTQTASLGYPFQYIWPEWTWIQQHSLFIFPSLIGVVFIVFSWNFLKVKEYTPALMKVTYVLLIAYFTGLLFAFFGYYGYSYRIIEITAMTVSLFMLFVAYRIAKKGFKPARFYLLAWSLFLLGVCVFILKDFGVLPFNNFTNYTMQFGTACEALLLSFALADRIAVLTKEKQVSQIEALKMAQENERIIREQNIVLEQKVTERTAELQQTNEELNTTLENLKDTQAQLVDSEKMASLGQLTAGIAHEINNPINFVTSNITPLKQDIDDIMEVLDKYGEITGDDDVRAQLKSINELKEDIDLEFVKEEVASLLRGIQEGAERTSEIVRGLKNFSRLDEDDLKKADLNEGIESTLTLLNNKLKDNISVKKNYGISSLIDCYPGKINQLLMNIINNAVQAIETRNDLSRGEGELTIETQELESEVVVKISDNGIGMDEQTKKKIFDPFYTTKDVGKGTGLGMSIVYKIIQNHNGRIAVDSVLGEGTTIAIYLPKKA